MKLRCVSRYDNLAYGWHFEPGAVFEVTEDEREFLLRDSPGSFVGVTETKQVEAPAEDKAVKSPPRSKARSK